VLRRVILSAAIAFFALAVLYVFPLKNDVGDAIAVSNLPKQDVVFRIYAPKAKNAYVAGSFNSWKTDQFPLERQAQEMWETTIPLAPGRYEYKFLVDSQWIYDVNNPARVPVPSPYWGYNSVIDVQSNDKDSLVVKRQPATIRDSLGGPAH
jgi:1,4-alpha-glucan branching enzyme